MLKVFVSTISLPRLWCRFVLMRGRGVVVDGAAVDHRAMTPATAGDVGGLSMRARPKCLSRLMLQESGAAPMDRLFWLFVEPIGINTDLPPLRMILSV